MCLCGYYRMEWSAFGEQWTVFKVVFVIYQNSIRVHLWVSGLLRIGMVIRQNRHK